MRYHGRFESPKSKKKKRGGSIALIVILLIVALLLGGFLLGKKFLGDLFGKVTTVDVPKIQYATEPAETAVAESTAPAQITIQTTEAPTTVPTTAPHVASSEDYINILVVGQAARGGGDEERMADTMILCTLNKHEKTLALTSILRDSLVQQSISMFGRTFGGIKLTTIYHLGSTYGDGPAGSMALMNQTLYNNFGIEVDYNVEVSFDSFIKAIDLLGGITVDMTQAEADYLNDPMHDAFVTGEVTVGPYKMDGSTALSYVRMRKAEGDADSDINRTARQRRMIQALFDRVKKMSISDIQNLANGVLPMVTTSMTSDEIMDMLMLVLPMLPDLKIVTSGTCPVEGTYWGDSVEIYKDGVYHSVLRFEPSQQKKLIRAITEGESAE